MARDDWTRTHTRSSSGLIGAGSTDRRGHIGAGSAPGARRVRVRLDLSQQGAGTSSQTVLRSQVSGTMSQVLESVK